MADEPEVFRMWGLACPFNKKGFPVMGSFGSRVQNVVVMTTAEWTRLCKAVPQLQITKFNVGTYVDGD